MCSGRKRNFCPHESRPVNRTPGISEDLPDSAKLIHPASQTVIRTAKQGNSIFNGAENCAGAVLPLRGAFAEPPIVRYVYKKIRVFLHVFAHQMRENILE